MELSEGRVCVARWMIGWGNTGNQKREDERRREAEQELEKGTSASGLTRPSIEKVGCSRQCLDPEFSGHAGVEKKTANAVIQYTNHALGFAILR